MQNVGELRTKCAYADGADLVEVETKDEALRSILNGKRIVVVGATNKPSNCPSKLVGSFVIEVAMEK